MNKLWWLVDLKNIQIIKWKIPEPHETVSWILDSETIDIFTNSKNTAEIISLSENKTSLDYYERVIFWWNENERGIIKKILRNPSNNLFEIKARQRVFDELLSDRVNLAELSEWKWESESFWNSLEYLWWYDGNEVEDAENERKKPRKRIQVLKEENKKFTVENFVEIENRLDKWLLNGKDFDEIIGRSHEILNLISLKKDLNDINKFITLLKTISNPVIQDLATKLEIEYKQINFQSVSYFVWLYLDWKDEEINKIFSLADKIYKILNNVGAFLSITTKLKEDWYAKASFDETKPMQFKQAWQFERCKERTWIDKKNLLPQKLNDSMDNTPCNVLVWDIMSGKSFQWELNKQLHICAQSIWYAPAKESNVHIFDRFVSIDRALTDSWKWLSAFGEDITNINKLLELNSKWWKTFLFMDEWGSTTSPEDQAILLKSILLYMTNKGIKVVLATHNEEFVKYIQDLEEFSTYHLEDKLNEDGTITFLYELKKWVWEHHILEAARTLWLPESICDTAEKYMKWNILPANIPEIKYRKIVKYTQKERETLKQESKSFMTLMPYWDEIIIFNKKEAKNYKHPFEIKEFPVLKWKYSLDDEDEDREERRNNWRWEEYKWYEHEEKPEYEKILSITSDDNDFKWTHFSWLKMKNRNIWQFITQSSIRDSQEIFEIQKMWEELIWLWTEKLENEIVELQSFLWHINRSLWTIKNNSVGFNQEMFELIYKEFKENAISKWDFIHSFRLFILSIKISLKLSWKNMMLFLNEQLVQFETVLKLKEEYKKFEENIDKWVKLQRTKKINKNELEIIRKKNYLKYKQIIDKAVKITWYDLSKDEWIEINTIVSFWCKKIWRKIYEHYKDKIEPFNLYDIDLQVLIWLINEEKEALTWYNWLSNDGVRFICWLYALIWQEINVYSLTNELKKYDSVYLNQISNYWENILKKTLWNISTWNDVLQIIKKTQNSDLEDNEWITSIPNFEKLSKDMWNLSTIIDIAKMIKENNLCKVDFNQTGSVVLDEPYNPIKPADKQRKNRYYFWEDQRVVIKTGANMSGKTQSLKHTVWPLAFANAIGYAPAKSMSTPLIDKIYWVDRIKARQDLNLSSWGTEVIVLKEILEQISKSNWMNIGFFDEMWSTVPPSYQTALTYATIREFMQKWVYIDISHHNHDFINKLTQNHPQTVEPVHFKTNILNDWTVSFDYKQERWHIKSQALLVAKTCWLIQEIMDIANWIKVN